MCIKREDEQEEEEHEEEEEETKKKKEMTMQCFSKMYLGELVYLFRNLTLHMGLVLHVHPISAVNSKFSASFIGVLMCEILKDLKNTYHPYTHSCYQTL